VLSGSGESEREQHASDQAVLPGERHQLHQPGHAEIALHLIL